MRQPPDLPKLYVDLAEWWPLLSSPDEYEEEARVTVDLVRRHARRPVKEVLELGSGGGNNAFHMKASFQMTLTDLSHGMLAVSQRINPEYAHHQGDMRSIRLDREFDAVFVHDAVMYMTSREDLAAAALTAFAHCRPGGLVLFAPDHVRETFAAGHDAGGHDAPNGRGLRYLEWTWDPDPADTSYLVEYAYLMRDSSGQVSVVHDRHREGLFDRPPGFQSWRKRASAGSSPSPNPARSPGSLGTCSSASRTARISSGPLQGSRMAYREVRVPEVGEGLD